MTMLTLRLGGSVETQPYADAVARVQFARMGSVILLSRQHEHILYSVCSLVSELW